LALVERGDRSVPEIVGGLAIERPPSQRLRAAIALLAEALRDELGHDAEGQQLWLLLDTAAVNTALETPSPLQVSRVLDEMRQRFLELRASEQTAVPDFEAFLREKMGSLGFDDLGNAPLLPELQREALRGLGVGLGSQMAQMLGRLAGWHGEAKPPKTKEDEAKTSAGVKLLRLELAVGLASDRAATTALRHELSKIRRRLSQRLGWELGAIAMAANKELEPTSWRLLLRGEPAVAGQGFEGLPQRLEAVIEQRAEALFPFSEFEAMLREPGCKLVVKELRSLGLEKAVLWTVCRRVVAAGGHLREPLTVLERILEASTTSHQLPFLVQSVLTALSPSTEV
jgi:hypothetical protein